MTTPQLSPGVGPGASRSQVPPAIAALLDAELSTPSRLGHVCLLVAAMLVTVAIAALWATEPDLPARTHWAFGALVGIGVSWSAYASWVLRQRRPLLAQDRVVAGWLAVVFTSVFVLGALFVAIQGGSPGPPAAAASGATLLMAAVVTLARARQERARLTVRRTELEHRLFSR